jgi:hypothetical protein
MWFRGEKLVFTALTVYRGLARDVLTMYEVEHTV